MTDMHLPISLPLILHIPHASQLILPDDRAALIPDGAVVADEVLRMTDAWTDKLVEPLALPAERITFPLSRLVVDVARAPDDALEPMAARGLGVVYTCLSNGAPLRQPDAAARRRLIETWYQSHHARLTAATDVALARHGWCLIVDVHSFASRPLPHEHDPDRPDISIGFDPYHTPFDDNADAVAMGAALGFSVGINRPCKGSMVPALHRGRTASVLSAKIAIRRDLYMDEATGRQLPQFDLMADKVCELVVQLASLAIRKATTLRRRA